MQYISVDQAVHSFTAEIAPICWDLEQVFLSSLKATQLTSDFQML